MVGRDLSLYHEGLSDHVRPAVSEGASPRERHVEEELSRQRGLGGKGQDGACEKPLGGQRGWREWARAQG